MLQMPETNTVDKQTPQITETNKQEQKQEQQQVRLPAPPNFGEGRYSLAMKEVYQDGMRIFVLSSETAEKIARQFGSDFGAYMREAIVEAKIGKSMSRDGKLTLAETSKVKGCTATPAISIARAIDYCNNALKFGVSVKNTHWKLAQELADWVSSLAK
jgi:hypothetical protein